jgi:uncharacterized membrane protein required for colicin V production
VVRTAEIVLLILVLLGGALGAWRGFARELLSIAEVLGAACLSRLFAGTTRSVLAVVLTFEDEAGASILSWVVGFAVIYLAFVALCFLLRKLLPRLRFRGDALSGFVLGTVRLALLIALLLPAVAWSSSENGAVRRAVTGIRPWGWLRNGAHHAREAPFVPPAYVEFVEDTPEIWQ